MPPSTYYSTAIVHIQIVSLLENVNEQGKLKLYRQDLIDNTKTIPLSDGLSCLAALPPQAWHLVPEPYSWLADESFDNLYSSCMDPETNVFDALSFERKCQGQIDQIASQRKAGNVEPANQERDESDQSNRNERRIYAGSKFWTVISHSYDPLNHPFAPPEPYAERVTRLRRSRRIMASKIPVTPGRHFRQNLPNNNDDTSRYDGSKGEASNSSALAEGGKSAGRDTGDLDDQLSIHDISYKSAFEHYTRKN